MEAKDDETIIPELSIEINERHRGIGHFAANKKYLVYECHEQVAMYGAFRELIVIVSLTDPDRKGKGPLLWRGVRGSRVSKFLVVFPR